MCESLNLICKNRILIVEYWTSIQNTVSCCASLKKLIFPIKNHYVVMLLFHIMQCKWYLLQIFNYSAIVINLILSSIIFVFQRDYIKWSALSELFSLRKVFGSWSSSFVEWSFVLFIFFFFFASLSDA